MRELSLFSGAGGGLLASKLLGWTTIGYVEWNEYCQQVIAQRINDGILDTAPIFTDVREFVQSGAARQYRGFVDVVSAGFPCQPFSQAGSRKGGGDSRNMWPATRDAIADVQPNYCYLENVPGLLAHEYGRRVFGDLAELGFNARWCVLGAADVGAPHRRKRLWIVAYTNINGFQRLNTLSGTKAPEQGEWSDIARVVSEVHRRARDCIPASWAVRKGARVADRVDRTKAIGNGQVPQVAKTAWELLTRSQHCQEVG